MDIIGVEVYRSICGLEFERANYTNVGAVVSPLRIYSLSMSHMFDGKGRANNKINLC